MKPSCADASAPSWSRRAAKPRASSTTPPWRRSSPALSQRLWVGIAKPPSTRAMPRSPAEAGDPRPVPAAAGSARSSRSGPSSNAARATFAARRVILRTAHPAAHTGSVANTRSVVDTRSVALATSRVVMPSRGARLRVARPSVRAADARPAAASGRAVRLARASWAGPEPGRHHPSPPDPLLLRSPRREEGESFAANWLR